MGLAESENLWGGDVVGRALQKGSGSAQASSSLRGKSFDQMSSTVLRTLGLEAGII